MSEIIGAPLTTAQAREIAPELLRNTVDERITKLRPMATPVDQLSRYAASRPCKSMAVDYYAVATRAASTSVSEDVEFSGDTLLTLPVAEPKTFDPSETIMLPTQKTEGGEPMVFYVVSVGDKSLRAKPVNIGSDSSGVIESGAQVIRMGRAAGELDVQTTQYEALPEKKQNYCQIFK